MKKLLCLSILCLLLFTGCEKLEGKYVEGVYEAATIDFYGGAGNRATAKVTIDKNGFIESIYLDTEYTTEDGIVTTKKTLGYDYGMKNYPNSAGEWFEQVEKLEQAIVENQGIDFLTLNENNKTDAVAGCTMQIDALKSATSLALEKALK